MRFEEVKQQLKSMQLTDKERYELALEEINDQAKRLKVAKDTNAHLLEAFDTKTKVHESLLKDYAVLKVRVEELEEECNRYREIFDKIDNTVMFTFPDKEAIYEVADILDESEDSK